LSRKPVFGNIGCNRLPFSPINKSSIVIDHIKLAPLFLPQPALYPLHGFRAGAAAYGHGDENETGDDQHTHQAGDDQYKGKK
jgi:hypothetical protein